MRNIQIIEPTLEGYSGYCHSLVSSFCRAAAGAQVDLWSAKGSANLDFGPGVTVHPYFSRRFRLFQSLFLFRRLLREPSPVFIPTAGRADLALLNLAAGKQIARNRVFLYFHRVRETADKLRFLRRIAARQPNLVILGTTASVVEVFRRCGFAHVSLLPYPPTQAQRAGAAMFFRRLLYAGAARLRDLAKSLQPLCNRCPQTILLPMSPTVHWPARNYDDGSSEQHFHAVHRFDNTLVALVHRPVSADFPLLREVSKQCDEGPENHKFWHG